MLSEWIGTRYWMVVIQLQNSCHGQAQTNLICLISHRVFTQRSNSITETIESEILDFICRVFRDEKSTWEQDGTTEVSLYFQLHSDSLVQVIPKG